MREKSSVGHSSVSWTPRVWILEDAEVPKEETNTSQSLSRHPVPAGCCVAPEARCPSPKAMGKLAGLPGLLCWQSLGIQQCWHYLPSWHPTCTASMCELRETSGQTLCDWWGLGRLGTCIALPPKQPWCALSFCYIIPEEIHTEQAKLGSSLIAQW